MSEWTIERIAGVEDRLRRHFLFAGLLTERLRAHGVTPILVGGGAVELYTHGSYQTADLDMIVARTDALAGVLSSLGLKRAGRSWYHPLLGVSVEFPADELDGDPARVTEVRLEGLTVRVIGIEDIVLDRVAAATHWKDRQSAMWAMGLMVAHYDAIDWSYCHRRAAQKQMLDAFERLQRRAKRALRNKGKSTHSDSY